MNLLSCAVVATACCVLTPALAQSHAELTSPTALRVCSDPHNLPFSNDKGEGFENKIAELLGRDLKLPVAYTYFPDSQGFVRATLFKGLCDVVMGTVPGNGEMATTSAYYHTGYMMVTREQDGVKANRVDDPSIAGRRFGLIGRTPPTDLLVEHSLMGQTAIYQLVVDTRIDQPAHTMLEDIKDHRVDVGLEWGPIAGFYIKREQLPLRMTFLDGKGSKVRLDYHIAMGVRQSDVTFRRKLNEAIGRNSAEITRILQDFGVPLLDEQGNPLGASAAKPG